MLTNPEILPVERIDASSPDLYFLEGIALFVGEWMHLMLGVQKDRFSSLHGLIYLLGVFVLVLFYLIEHFGGLFSKAVNFKCCCLRKTMQ
jgi:hypothetical protein